MSERDWQKDWDLCQRATPGPWRFEVYYIKPNDFLRNDRPIVSWWGVVAGTHDAGDFEVIVANESCVDIYELDEQEVANMHFIAEAREALPYWLRRYKELHAKWFADVEEKIRLRYTNQQLQEELVRLKGIILQFARYADDHKVVLVCPEEASECNSLCSACWQAALDGRKEGEEG